MEDKEKRKLWDERIEAFLASGLNRKAWCEQKGLRVNQLSYWLNKQKVKKGVNGSRWACIDTTVSSNPEISLEIGPAVLKIDQGFNQAVLANVVRILMTIC